MNPTKNERSNWLEFLIGCVFAFAVFALSFGNAEEAFLSYIKAFWVILPVSTLAFALPERADKTVVFVAVNGPAALLWYVLVPDSWPFLSPLIITLTLSLGAIAVACVVGIIRRIKAS